MKDDKELSKENTTENSNMELHQESAGCDFEESVPQNERVDVTSANNSESYISENETYGGRPTTFKGKLSNFWYHHKFGTIASVLCVFIVVVIIVQLATRTKIDLNIIYAGGYNISRIQEDGMPSEYEEMLEGIKNIGEDFDENGEIKINILDYYYLTEDEMGKSEEDLDYQRISAARKDLQSQIQAGEACLLFLSSAIYEDLYYNMGETFSDGQLFSNISQYVNNSKAKNDVEYYDETKKAIYLKSLKFSELPGFSSLPDDTVVCLRIRNENTIWENEEEFNNSVVVLKNLLNFGY